MSSLEKGLAIFVKGTGMSRGEYDALRDLLHLLRNDDGSPIQAILNLPRQVSSVKQKLRSRLPLMNFRREPRFL